MSTSSRESPARITRGTQRCVFLQRWIKSAVLACLCYGSAAGGANLFTDPTFREIHELSLMPPPRGWYWQRIQTPCRVMASPAQRSVTLEGGKVFLDSVPAELSPSTQHDFALQVSGTATFSVEFLHWTRRGLPAQPHRILLHKPAPLTATPLTIRVTFRSPPEISLGQLRLIAEQGTAVVSAPSLAISAGKLLLSLDAAQPGPRPGTHWQDLTRLNRDFVLSKGVRHVAETKSYVFDAPGARCRGALEDAAHFNFETDVAAGPGQGDPFTGVFYAKLTDGLSGSGIINLVESKVLDIP